MCWVLKLPVVLGKWVRGGCCPSLAGRGSGSSAVSRPLVGVPAFVAGKRSRVALRLQAGPRQCGHDLGFLTVGFIPFAPHRRGVCLCPDPFLAVFLASGQRGRPCAEGMGGSASDSLGLPCTGCLPASRCAPLADHSVLLADWLRHPGPVPGALSPGGTSPAGHMDCPLKVRLLSG